MEPQGLVYPPHLLDHLPLLHQSDNPIRALNASQFAALHLQHTLAHPPDNVLFPFLHGLEGDNHAQNTFFASSSFSGSSLGSTTSNPNANRGGKHHYAHNAGNNDRITPKVPHYRGLAWVVCEEDLERAGDQTTLRVLRRKPAGAEVSPPFEDQPTPSSSDDDGDLDLDDESSDYVGDEDLEEDEQDILLMMQAEDAKASISGGVDASISSNPAANTSSPPTSSGSSSARRPSTASTSTSPDLAIDDDPPSDEDLESVLSSPIQIPMPMQVDAVHVVQDTEDDGILDDVLGINASDATEGKDESHFEGTHMHPVVAHRPTLSTSTSPGVGLGITTPTTFSSSSGSTSSSRPPSTSSSPSEEMEASPLSAAASALSSDAQSQSQTQIESSEPQRSSQAQQPSQPHPRRRKSPTNPAAPPLLTSTFRPKELLRRARGVKLQIVTSSSSLSQPQPSVNARPLNGGVGVNGVSGPPGRRKDSGGGGCGIVGEEAEEDEEQGWEFVPARVPDGISLRNFGIQVPIYATLSDIIIYSPFGATPAALALARRFRTAICAKRAERLQAAGLGGEEDEDDFSEDEGHDISHNPNDDNENATKDTQPQISDEQRKEKEERAEKKRRRKELLQYNVFVLDAEEEELRQAVPYLMMRICGAGVPGGTSSGQGQGSADGEGAGSNGTAANEKNLGGADVAASPLCDIGAHTDGPDGHVIELAVFEAEAKRRRMEESEKEKEKEVGMDMDMVVDMDMGEAMDVDRDVDVVRPNHNHREEDVPKSSSISEKKKEEQQQAKEEVDDLHLIPNTVDFALREREEMRDLTKASEIISLRPIAAPVSLSLSPNALSALGGPSRPLAALNSRANSDSTIKPPQIDVDADRAPVWDPRVGQVFLGNSGDVPLAPDVPSHFRHAASVPRDADEAARWDWEALTGHLRGVDGLAAEYDFGFDKERKGGPGVGAERQSDRPRSRGKDLSEDDPFNYIATNDPASGFGYDICVECHDLAPFPSSAHLRAAEDHLGMLDVMWRERWEKAWVAREERQVREENENAEEEGPRIPNTPPTPPRPPPHANAVIHLPFPSSPSNSQATMVALMPVIRFLEKWIQPLPVPVVQPPPPPPPEVKAVDPKGNATTTPAPTSASRRWSTVTSLMPSFPSFPGVGSSSNNDSKKEQTQANAAPTPPPAAPLPPHPARMRSLTSPSSSQHQLVHPPTPVQARTRPLKILLYSSDGYTESSVPALCLLMAIKSLMLPEAYLELQVEKRRSFFVYQGDLGILRRVEGRLREEREREKEKERERERERERVAAGAYLSSLGGSINANGKRTAPAPVPTRGGYWSGSGMPVVSSSSSSANSGATIPRPPSPSRNNASSFMGRPAAKSVSFAHGPPPVMASSHYSQQQQQQPQHQVSIPPKVVESQTPKPSSIPHSGSWPLPAQQAGFSTSVHVQHSAEIGGYGGMFTNQQPQPQPQMGVVKGRPRASTSPWLPSLFAGDHQSWFNDPRFDGSFPSRVLPFLYLGNLNHASNVYMLHALGITHVVSVGECALVPPPHHMTLHSGSATAPACYRPGPGAHFVPGKGPGGHGSLWIEEREGRIKVLDIKGVCDDGIDTLEPQLEPICDWIDKARQEGGQVLVHCRVGVSRSATVTIAYVMKHLGLPLVDAYLIVRSRRLSVLIQPNMRLLYNLCGWEIKLAKERANGEERKLKKELARTLTWPYLAKEVHALNEKYLH